MQNHCRPTRHCVAENQNARHLRGAHSFSSLAYHLQKVFLIYTLSGNSGSQTLGEGHCEAYVHLAEDSDT